MSYAPSQHKMSCECPQCDDARTAHRALSAAIDDVRKYQSALRRLYGIIIKCEDYADDLSEYALDMRSIISSSGALQGGE